MTEKKKIIIWAIVVVVLAAAVLFLLLGGKGEAGTEVPRVEMPLQQEEGTPIAEEVLKPTQESEPGVVELPFIPVD